MPGKSWGNCPGCPLNADLAQVAVDSENAAGLTPSAARGSRLGLRAPTGSTQDDRPPPFSPNPDPWVSSARIVTEVLNGS